MKGNLLCAFEGLSGCGKTSISERVAQRIGGQFYKTPSKLFLPIREDIDERASLEARFLFYLAGMVQSSVEIKDLLTRTHVVCDRWIYSTVCYHKTIGVDVSGFERTISGLLKPDFVFLVICKENARRRRLKNRGMTYNDHEEAKEGVEERFLSEYRSHDLIEIDNSDDDPTAEKAVLEVLRKIGF